MLSRDIIEWEWYHSPNVFRLYIHLLLKANFKPKKWQGQVIKRGELITSIGHLSSELMITNQSIRTALSKLESSGYIILRPTNRYTLISLVNYDNLQTFTSKSNKNNSTQLTSRQQSNNKQLTTTKERDKVNKVNKEKIEERRENFKKQVFENSQYDLKILNSFYNYWSEFNSNKSKMRCEKDGFFNVQKRLERWGANERVKNVKGGGNFTESNR